MSCRQEWHATTEGGERDQPVELVVYPFVIKYKHTLVLSPNSYDLCNESESEQQHRQERGLEHDGHGRSTNLSRQPSGFWPFLEQQLTQADSGRVCLISLVALDTASPPSRDRGHRA